MGRTDFTYIIFNLAMLFFTLDLVIWDANDTYNRKALESKVTQV